ncbi:MAG: VWA domain-containing protein [Deltaproteobacteria bacterium]|nr:VWA domain-containing protein [Deltaproteobacteria bacterium]
MLPWKLPKLTPCLWPCLLICLLASGLPGGAALAAPAPALPEVMFILDGSGSMLGPAGNQTKIAAARQVLDQVVPALPPGVKVGLAVYGHRKKGDCADVEILAPPGSEDRAGLLAEVAAIHPKGKTPIAGAVKLVAEQLKTREAETTLVLVSDGLETCEPDPCGVVKALHDSGIKFVLHVVGFGLAEGEKDQLACLAQAGGGQFFLAQDAAGLRAALDTVKGQVAQKVEAAKTSQVAVKTGLGKLKITMPASTVKSLAAIQIVKAADGAKIKEAQPAAEGVHPLPAGEYKVVLAFANPNYQPATLAPLEEVVTVSGGETKELALGAVVLNLAPGLGGATETVGLVDQDSERPFVELASHGNGYYLFKPKPLPAGTYTLRLTYARNPTAYPVAKDLKVRPGQETVVTLDSGVALKKGGEVTSWEVLPAGTSQVVLKVQRRFDNDYPLWEQFPLPPGNYDLRVMLNGMAEPLPVAQGLTVAPGQTLVVETGL